MTKTTHMVGGALFSLALGAGPLGIAVGTFGGLLPDIDHTQSTLGKKIKPISKLLKHRGGTHSIFFVLLVYFIFYYLIMFLGFDKYWLELRYIAIGVISHLILDMCNKRGVQLFFPIKGEITFPIINIKTRTMGETIFCVLEVICFIGLMFIKYSSAFQTVI